MKNITLSADDDLIEKARSVARARRKTLNAAFREWLEHFVSETGSASDYDSLMSRLRHVQSGRRFSRDERNER
jgi:predicted transcriptional regulator